MKTSPEPSSASPHLEQLSLGTAAVGMDYGATNTRGPIPSGEFGKILSRCRVIGIRGLDTAQNYGPAEEILGRFGVADFLVTTKITLQETEKAGSILEMTRTSLKRLRVKKLGGMLLHNERRLDAVDGAAVATALQDLKSLGLAERVGISSYEPARALELCEKHGFDVVQLPFNLLDTRLLQDDVLQRFLAQGIEVQTRSAFLQGILLGVPQGGRSVPQRVLDESALFRRKCKEQGRNPLGAAIGYPLATSPRIKIVIGVTGQDELETIVRALSDAKPLEKYKSPIWSPEFDPRTWEN